jgi:hypothetical protein
MRMNNDAEVTGRFAVFAAWHLATHATKRPT